MSNTSRTFLKFFGMATAIEPAIHTRRIGWVFLLRNSRQIPFCGRNPLAKFQLCGSMGVAGWLVTAKESG
jgi:hypothetical protein